MDLLREAVRLATQLLESRQFVLAESVCRRGVTEYPRSPELWFLLGAAQQIQGRPSDAITAYESSLALAPAYLEARNNLGAALCAVGRVDEAAAALEGVLGLRPDYPDGLNNLGNVRQRQGRPGEATACYQRAIELRPGFVDAIHNLGNAERSLGRLADAVATYERALALAPDDPRIRLARALAWLQMGDFTRGWPEYEWRLKCPEHAIPALPGLLWDGSLLEGRTILLYADSGLGDGIQFLRYAKQAAGRGGRVILACRQPLVRLAASAPGLDTVVGEGENLPALDVHAPLMSMPRILGETQIPERACVPYLHPDREAVLRHRARLLALPGLRVGVVWQGNPAFVRDTQRSFRLEQLEPIARIPNISLVSLQKGAGSEQASPLRDRIKLLELGPEFADLADTAAAMQSLDLVIAPDTAIVHLAGATGVRTWVALAHAADWRWQSDREDSPWYPTLRLFRQTGPGDWAGVFERMAATLRQEFTEARPATSAP